MDIAASRERHRLMCCPSCFLSKSHIMSELAWSLRQHWTVHLLSEVILRSWHHPQKWCNSIYEKTLLTRGFSCSEDWKIINDVVPQARNEWKKIFNWESSENKGVAVNLNVSASQWITEHWLLNSSVSMQSLEQCRWTSIEAHLDLCLNPWFLLPSIAVPQTFIFL